MKPASVECAEIVCAGIAGAQPLALEFGKRSPDAFQRGIENARRYIVSNSKRESFLLCTIARTLSRIACPTGYEGRPIGYDNDYVVVQCGFLYHFIGVYNDELAKAKA